jgi:F0F1-type ATP synthase delta subunit
MPNTLYNDIFTKVRTTADAEQLMSQLDLMLTNLYKVDKEQFEKTINHNLNYDIADSLKNTLHSAGISPTNHEDMKLFLTGLKAELQSCEIITLTIAFEPSAELVTTISDWVHNNLGSKVLLEVNVDPYIIGGAIIIFNGKYLNISVKKKLDDILTRNQEQILKQLA